MACFRKIFSLRDQENEALRRDLEDARLSQAKLMNEVVLGIVWKPCLYPAFIACRLGSFL